MRRHRITPTTQTHAGTPGRRLPTRLVDSVAGRLLLPGVAVGVVLLAAFLAQRDATSTLSWNVRAQALAEQEVARDYQTETLLLDLETGVRGFLLTHDRVFLQPWQSARTAFPESSAVLVELEAHDSAVQLGLAKSIQNGGDTYISDFATPEILTAELNPAGAANLPAALQGKRRLDSLRPLFAELIKLDERPAAPAERRAQAAAGLGSSIGLAGLALALALIAAAQIYISRGVLRPIRQVGEVADEMAAGDLSARVEPASATELSRLATSFNTMADALRDGRDRLEDQATKLRASEAFLDSVLENIPNMLFVKEPDELRFVRFNRAGEQLLGYTREQLLGKNADDLFPPDEAAFFTTKDRETLATGAPVDIPEEPIQTRYDGVRYLHTKKIPVLDEHGEPQYLLGISEDITERKRAQDTVRAAKEEAERANHAKSQFLSRMSHEVRTPLNSILGFGQVLEMDGVSEDQRQPVRYILQSGRHLLRLIEEVLDMARIEAGNLTIATEPVAVGALLRDLAASVAPIAAERNVRIETDPPGFECYVLADPRRITQVLLNLLSNAIKYNHEGGEVRIVFERAGPNLLIRVRDTGRGIPAGRLSEVFAPFERLGAEFGDIEGTGLGLALSKELMEMMGGTLTVDSQAGAGSTFTAEFELAPETGTPAIVGDLGEGCEHDWFDASQKFRLLYVDDKVANIKLVERVLARRPAVTVEATAQGQLGIELARHHPPDVIVLDVHLPDLPGELVLGILKNDAVTERIPVIMLTADADPEQAMRLLDRGAAACLTKPLDVSSFLAAIDEVLLIGSLVPK